MLTALTGEWHPGAASRDDGIHPFRKPLSQLRLGDRIASAATYAVLTLVAKE